MLLAIVLISGCVSNKTNLLIEPYNTTHMKVTCSEKLTCPQYLDIKSDTLNFTSICKAVIE